MLEVSYDTARPSMAVLNSEVKQIVPNAEIQYSGSNEVLIQTAPINEQVKSNILAALGSDGNHPTQLSFNTIGPSVGHELRSQAIISIIIISIAIILFIAFAFRKVAKPISSWTYGLIAIVVLVHDVVIPAGFFSLLHLQVDTLFVVGLLTILGISINDTIVVFDRIRENLHVRETSKSSETFAQTVGKSISQTFTRSIMTSVAVLIALAALYLFGPDATRTLSIAMFLGMFFGTYSSIFLAAPLLVVWNDFKTRNVSSTKKA